VVVKFIQYGSIQIQTVALREPYFGEAEPADHHLIWSQEELNRAVTEAHSSGWQV
jgi:predicted amidohydrolase YtcJ